MALTQAARLPRPSWDEEVVPALRKRLESESRTLARRISAISLSSVDDVPSQNFTTLSQPTKREILRDTSPQNSTSAGRLQTPGRTTPSASPRINGVQSQKKPAQLFKRARTYSQPYTSDIPVNGAVRQRTTTGKLLDPSRSKSPRLTDPKPTRIPKASRGPSSSNASSPSLPYSNGYNTPKQSIDLHGRGSHDPHGTPKQAASPRSVFGIPNSQMSGLMNEPPPFPPSSTSSSISHSQNGEASPRASSESEERPFEHWYRGEVSRNGGVGELRVGRKQEMLEIANYGHLIGNKKLALVQKQNAQESWRHRKRADSIGGLTNKERERESLYLDDERANQVGRVLDESPLTDLDGEGSENESILLSNSNHNDQGYGSSPEADDDTPPATVRLPTHPTHAEARSNTPTPASFQRPPSRPSSELNMSTPTHVSMKENASPSYSSPSNTPSPPPILSSSSTSQTQSSSPLQTPRAPKRGASPGSMSVSSQKSRTAASKATRAKTAAARKEQEEEKKRSSVAYYPTPAEGGDIMNAIPSWTQPVPRTGNWDEVVLPVVARKKGMDDHYEKADGSPRLKSENTEPAPAPGTFGFDHSKYRPPRLGDANYIPMDEFGRTVEPIPEQPEAKSKPRLPPLSLDTMRNPVHAESPPSPAPFAHYRPTEITTVQMDLEARKNEDIEEEKGAGCCKCVVM